MDFIDVVYLGNPRLIACGVIESEAGLLLVDPGPGISLPTLVAGLEARGASVSDVHAVLLTHIHLDHAGATGALVAQNPNIRVYVHAHGARHLVDPSRLLLSAARIYGDEMESTWGAFLAVPSANVAALRGGETIRPGGRVLEVTYTPGHAVHHVAYFDTKEGTAFVGDACGMRVAGCGYVMPVAPPPDIDVEAWHGSLERIRAWQADVLFPTHFGPSPGADRQVDEMKACLDSWAARVRRSLERDEADEAAAARFHEEALAEMLPRLPESVYPLYADFGMPRRSWYGLARYLRKKQAQRRPA